MYNGSDPSGVNYSCPAALNETWAAEANNVCSTLGNWGSEYNVTDNYCTCNGNTCGGNVGAGGYGWNVGGNRRAFIPDQKEVTSDDDFQSEPLMPQATNTPCAI